MTGCLCITYLTYQRLPCEKEERIQKSCITIMTLMVLIACMQVTPGEADLLQQTRATRKADPAALDAIKDCIHPAGQAFGGGLLPTDVSPQAKARGGSIAGNPLDMTDRTHSAAHRQGSPAAHEGSCLGL
jgi:hypothetical protein